MSSLAKLAAALPELNMQLPRSLSSGGEQRAELQSEWAFWYMRRQGSRSDRQEAYEQSIKPLGSPFKSVVRFSPPPPPALTFPPPRGGKGK